MNISSSIPFKPKIAAFLIHCVFSACIIGIFMAIVMGLWFPDNLFELEDVWEGLKILIPVYAIVGPLLTLILYAPNKKGLKIDISMIAIFQIVALLYGGWTIYGQRPAVFVFAGDRFEIIPYSEFDQSKLLKEYYPASITKYPLITYALPGQNNEEKKDFIFNNIQYQKSPERYRPLNDYIDILRKRALDINNFKPGTSESTVSLVKFIKRHKNNQDILLFPLQGTTFDSIVLVLDIKGISNAGYIDIDPWSEYSRK
ncbi:MAG: hypothetical protein KAS48_04245, partial [Gammaproteobacteria bacterium]|nr:hypothetical protein [Gammaproteobacteria bacterium]